MGIQYFCKNKNRRQTVRDTKDQNGKPVINGIDYLEVGTDQKVLKVYFIHNFLDVPSATVLSKDKVIIEGGERIKGIQVVEPFNTQNNILTVNVDKSGDFSTYTLRLVKSATDKDLPDGFDPQLSNVDFSFKINCPSDFDCQKKRVCLSEPKKQPDINYIAKDYASFRQLMFDRLSVLMPDWQERNPADLGIALVELLAYAGDYLSYQQDAVATEAYLGTARSRISVRRHARLVDYFMYNGCNARTCVWIKVNKGSSADGATLTANTPLLTQMSNYNVIVDPSKLKEIVEIEKPVVFETMHEIVLHSSHDEINFYTWSDNECCLPKGATRATLRNDPNDPQLSITQDDINKGVFLLFEEVLNPETGKEEDADPAHHHVVRLTKIKTKDANSNDLKDPLTGDKIAEIEWHHDDALPFPLCLSARVGTEVKDVSIARGNIVFADHGMSVEYPLFPEEVPKQGSYHARLTKGPLSYKEDFDQTKSAASAVKQNLRKAMPVIELISEGEPWDPKYDLLASDKFAKEFVVEMESDGIAHLRFGDGILGKKPHAGADFTARYRVSNGRAGNVGAETITHIVTDKAGIEQITNPLPAVGGTDPETIEHVRQAAPWAFRTQERAVTPEDYAEVAQRHAEVQRAVATFRWTGSWYTVFLTIDRRNGLPIDDAFEKDIRKHMEKYRMAGYDLEVDSPQFVSLEIEMSVCIKPDYFRSNVNEVLLQVFSNLILPDGQKGIFHPDNFTFGQTVYLSPIYAAAQATEGVDSVKITKFQRQGIKSNDALDAGKLILGRLEIARLDNDPNYPEHGVLSINVEGGK